MAKINTICFDEETSKKLKQIKYGTNWPIVYIINNDKEAYIGETTNASMRASQHYANDIRKNLNFISIISDEKFNKSSALDLEAFLIKYMSADNKYKLQNSNGGLKNHNYYQKEMYERKFKEIWMQLKAKKLVYNDLKIIENSDLFKYSPYKALTDEQYMVVNDIFYSFSEDIKNNVKSTFLVHGGAGTGKTILGIYMLKLLADAKDNKLIMEDDEIEDNLQNILKIQELVEDLKIGLVVPMDNLRATLKKVFKNIKGLNAKMVLSPNDVAKSDIEYDLLIVDEGHRLRRRKNLTQYKTFDSNNRKLGLDNNGTELDWILLKSKYQIIFYDEKQTIKPTDVRKEKFDELLLKSFDNPTYKFHPYFLETQMRCLLGGNEYVEYIKNIFSDNPPKNKIKFKKYDLKLFNNVNDMVENIKAKDKEYGLCRNIAGYAWPWSSKGSKLPLQLTKSDIKNIINKELYDLNIDGYKYIWNTKPTDWINSSNSVNEIGSIHTTQGFDLNYTGLIIGNDLRYDLKNKKFIVDRKNYFDSKGKADTTDEELLEYILNIYAVMCTRGMLGTYIYVCDEGLREYLKKYIN